jgi:hypothetical protein
MQAQSHRQDSLHRGGITLLGEPEPSVWDPEHYRTVPVMDANGIVDAFHFSLARNPNGSMRKQSRGLSPAEFTNGQVQLTPYGIATGHVFYKDVCDGTAKSRVGDRMVPVHQLHPDVDGQKFWRAWQEHAKAQLAGKLIRASKAVIGEDGRTPIGDKFGDSFYHPESKRRRNQMVMGGAHAVDADAALQEYFGEPAGPDGVYDPPAEAVAPPRRTRPREAKDD